MDFAFEDRHGPVLGLNRGTRQVIKFFKCSNDCYNAISGFLAVNASLRWLNNVNGVYLIQVSLLLIIQQV
jgi:hypothetical protein